MRTSQIASFTTSSQDNAPLKTNNTETDDGQSVVTDVIKSEDGSNRIVNKVCDKNLLMICACGGAMSLSFGVISGLTTASIYLGVQVGSTIWGLSTVAGVAVGIKNYITATNNQKQTDAQPSTEQEMLRKV